MKTRFLLSFSVILFLIPQGNFAQGRIFKNYSVKDGLASSTIYGAFQDSKGFIWFTTDQGVSRFDGTHFKTFTTADGLPDNEVFKTEEDTTGRLWFLCYNSRPCFLQNGTIHNSDNDSLLNHIEPQKNMFSDIVADREGRVWILGSKIYVITQQRLFKFLTPEGLIPTRAGYWRNRFCLSTNRGVYQVDFSESSLSYHLVCKLDGRVDNKPGFFEDVSYCYSGENRRRNLDTESYRKQS